MGAVFGHDGTPARRVRLTSQPGVDYSAISDEVAAERGYWSASKPADLNGHFKGVQKLAPALVIPVFNTAGVEVFCQLRPDKPREVRGKALKYETPTGKSMALDEPASTLPHLGNPKVTLWVREGIRKADALASVGLRSLALLGVWNWRGKNEHGGTTALPDWHDIALNERKVVLCFDSDSFQNAGVHRAVEELGRWLEHRKAVPCFVYLPSDGGKVGVDDYLAAGHGKGELTALIEDRWRPMPSEAERPKARRPQTEEERAAAPAETRELLGAVEELFRRFVVPPSDSSYRTLALFVLHTWAFEAAHAAPYININSPEKRSGKSRTLEVLELVTHRPIKVASITAAALFQSVSVGHPTLLIDEVDAIFGGDGDKNEDLRGVLNAGNMPGSPVIRGGKDGEPRTYDVYCPKVLAGIATGKLPDTVKDRAITISIDRKLKSERTERLKRRKIKDELYELKARLSAWAEQNHEILHVYELPGPFEEIDDRLEEAWEPLLAIADLAGEVWFEEARTAAIFLAGKVEEDGTASHELLLALKDVFDASGEEAMGSERICVKLNENDSFPFGGWNNGHGISQRELARHLKKYRTREGAFIKPRTVRVKIAGESATAMGYRREQFESAWERYGAPSANTPRQPNNHGGIRGFPIQHKALKTTIVLDAKTAKTPVEKGMWRMCWLNPPKQPRKPSWSVPGPISTNNITGRIRPPGEPSAGNATGPPGWTHDPLLHRMWPEVRRDRGLGKALQAVLHQPQEPGAI